MSDITGRPARLADYSPPKHKNGPQQPTPAVIPLPDAYQHKLDAAMCEHFAIEAERDALQRELANTKTELAAAKATITMLESNVIASESRVVSYQIERDKAVSELAELRGKYETVFESIRVLIERFVPPAVTESAA